MFLQKAVTYYKAAIKTSGQNAFRYDLAHLLCRLKRYKESQTIITNALEISQTQSICCIFIKIVKYYLIYLIY